MSGILLEILILEDALIAVKLIDKETGLYISAEIPLDKAIDLASCIVNAAVESHRIELVRKACENINVN